MKGFENISQEVAKDLIEVVNSITGLKKSKSVNYRTKNGVTAFNYVPLDDILIKIKENNNFAWERWRSERRKFYSWRVILLDKKRGAN